MLGILWKYLLKPGAFLLLLMQVMKAAFLYSNHSLIKNEPFLEIIQSFTNSFSLDIASLAYLLFVPTLLIGLGAFFKAQLINLLQKVYYILIASILVAVNWIDIQMFSYWSAKISAKALSYLNTPEMVIASAGKARVIIMFVCFIFTLILFYLYFRKTMNSNVSVNKVKRQSYLYLIPVIALLILALRGGLREIPINQSDAYYSDNYVLNVAGVNSIWNLGNVLFQNQNTLTDNPYKLLPNDQAQTIFNRIRETPIDTTILLLKTKRPNIVYLALEGVNANCINQYNSANNYMPEVSKIMDQAYSFKRMYASGMRTDQGLVAVLSGFPALPLHTIGAQPEKFQHLPSLSLDLKNQSYANQFFFAGEPEFGSFKAFLIHNGFEKVYSLDDFEKNQLSQDLGAPDEYLFEKFLEEMQNPKEPFFSLMLTQTSHEPYDMPFNEDVENDAQKYINTVKYVDSLIGRWYGLCSKMPWFENTLFVISSDHGHTFPDRYWYTDKHRYQIPFILFGPALLDEYKGLENTRLVNQTDIPYSIAKQLNINDSGYKFSKDIMNPYSPEYSSFIHIHGHDWIRNDNECYINYDIDNRELVNKNDLDSCFIENAAYFQVAFSTYLNY